MNGRDHRPPTPASAKRGEETERPQAPGKRAIDRVATRAVENKGGGEPVDESVRTRTEAHLGVDLSSARVHRDPGSAASADAIGARAFAHGEDIYLGTGESPRDVELMAHELTHVAQQGSARRKVIQREVTVGEENSPAEAEADATAAAVASGETPSSLLVETGQPVTEGQMEKGAFIEQLRAAVTTAANEALSPLFSADDCPYIERWLAHYRGQSVEHCESVIRRYAPQARGAQRAQDWIPMIAARVRSNVASWALTGVLPEEAAAIAPSGAAEAAQEAGTRATQAAEADGARPKLAEPRSPADLGPGEPLSAGVASRMSDALGEDVGGVRVHTDDQASAFAASQGAKAVTAGQDIAFRSGEYNPGSPAGDALLAHELAHTVQQRDASADVVQRQPGSESAAAERDADRATRGVFGRLYGGVKSAAKSAGDIMKTSFQLQRCSDSPDAPATPVDPFVAQLEAKLDASDTAGFFSDLRGENGGRAGNGPLRTGLERFNTEGKLSAGNTFRAILIQELGPDDPSGSEWPIVVRNFADGVDSGQFTVGLSSVPLGAQAIREFCMLAAHRSGEGTGVLEDYRGRFNSKWESSPFDAMSDEFDPNLDSKGPKNPRARAIFNDIYGSEATIRTAYDSDTPSGFRETADTHAGPTGTNLIASPRLDALRAAFNGGALSPAPTAPGDASYTTFLGVIRPLAAALTSADQAAISDDQQRWRALYVAKLGSGAPAALVSHLQSEVQDGSPAAPPARNPNSTVPPPTVAPTPPGSGPAPTPTPGAPAPLTPGSPEHRFVHNVSVRGPARVDIEEKNKDVEFTVESTTANPSLTALNRHIEVTPSAQVDDFTHEDTSAWPVGDRNLNHFARLNPRTTNPTGETQFNASVEMQPYGHTVSTSRATTVRDKRLDMLRRDGDAGLGFAQGRWVSPTNPRLSYHGNQLTVYINPNLGGNRNPGLTLFVRGEVKHGGTVVPGGTLNEVPFHDNMTSTRLGRLNVVQPSPPVATGDNYTLDVEFLDGPGGSVLHTVPTKRFKVHPGTGGTTPAASDGALLTRDRAALLAGPSPTPPSGTPTTMLDYLKYPPASLNPAKRANYQRVSAAIAAGVVPVAPMIVRSDSAHIVSTNGGSPESQVAYAMGSMAMSDVMIEQPGWDGWQFYANSTIFLNRTPNPASPGTTRPVPELADFAAHEAVHSTDTKPPVAPFDKYRAEFRAYWVDGSYEHEDTYFDPSYSFGPKSPRANAIFLHLYQVYDHTRNGYDNDSDFRERVDNYLYPDGINLIVSVALNTLRADVNNTSGNFATRFGRIQTTYGTCTTADKAEITGSRAWRDLVESKFGTATAPVPGATPARSEPEVEQIKDLLHIPR